MSRPKVVRSGRRLQVSRSSTQRIRALCNYPIKSSNGSLITLSGSSKGLYVTWTGGRPLHFTSRSERNTTNGHDGAEDQQDGQKDPESDDEALFESDEEDVDDDQPYPSVVQDLELPLQSPVIHLAICPLPTPENDRDSADVPTLLTKQIVVAVACENGSAKIITLPLDPPSATTKRKRKLGARICDLEQSGHLDVPRSIAMTWTASEDKHRRNESRQRQTRHSTRQSSAPARPSGKDLLVALATSELSGSLNFYSIPILSSDSVQHLTHQTALPFHSTYLDSLATTITFNPSSYPSDRHAQLLVGDVQGHISTYDLSASSESGADSRSARLSPRLVIQFSTPYTTSPDPMVPALSHRKRVLSAAWILGGVSILVLLEDGTIGLYALNSSPPTNIRSQLSPLTFAASAFIGNEPEQTSTTFERPKRAQLAPMTPNTRRTKSEGLFSGPSSTTSHGPRGGIAVRSATSTHGSSDDAAVIYYNTRVCAIPSIREWWSRNAPREGPSLHGTGMQDLSGIDLGNEIITSVHILGSAKDEEPSVLGANALKGDVLVVGEYRTHLLSAVKQKTPKLFTRDESPTRVDRRLLEQGELGVDGLDRMLDSMEGVERRVGFMD
ncbi:hypothetical protein BDZ85DRAFT_321884 [Elsinoe ampelina]|uniref:Uncharacterized protein n=1 Tax=Elsinoe ampelina TaxID=302913 RepID=A0A6A6G2P0_9PEZI|nr:hypothetical protein BDZ85DRAFT_321884 [Elsinoe ampelina]